MQMKGFTWTPQPLSSPLPQAHRLARDEEDRRHEIDDVDARRKLNLIPLRAKSKA